MIFFFGPLPPPVHGFAVINQEMVKRLGEVDDVKVFNTAVPPARSRLPAPMRKGLHWIVTLLRFVAAAIWQRPESVYLGLSGGFGQLFDMLFILAGRISGARIFVHHHSFVYLNQIRAYNRLCLAACGTHATHIVLCSAMSDRLCAGYRIDPARVVVLSNAAFLAGSVPVKRRPAFNSPVLGFISNIIPEKGIREFFAVVASLNQRGMQAKGTVAGPVSDAFHAEFFSLLARHPQVHYVGPVYEKDKQEFFQSIDLLLFPTQYRNEAEPLIVLEALRDGVPVLAAQRGCISGMLSQDSGMAFPDIRTFVADASAYIEALVRDPLACVAIKEGAATQFAVVRSKHALRLALLISEIARPRRPRQKTA